MRASGMRAHCTCYSGSGALRKGCACLLFALLACALLLSGCGAGEGAGAASPQAQSPITGDANTMIEIADPAEKAAVEAAMAKVQALGREPRIVATSPAAIDICDRLGLDLVGVCESDLYDTPARYAGAQKVGTPMSPDMEAIGALGPDWVLSPNSLQGDLQPKYDEIGTDYAFMNLKSVQGMYSSIQELGEIFGRRDEAQALVNEFTQFYSTYQVKNANKQRPKVLVLMGLPGSYVIATENSYVGSLVELAGGENVYAGTSEDFLTVNTEDMKGKEPDVILRAVHALPDQVLQMFDEDFRTNDVWKHFTAVQEGRVFDLPYDTFGMSASFNYPLALEQLQPMLYPESGSAASSAPTGNGTSATLATPVAFQTGGEQREGAAA